MIEYESTRTALELDLRAADVRFTPTAMYLLHGTDSGHYPTFSQVWCN